jgi:hypothetical protein
MKKKTNFRMAIVRFLIEGCIELGLSALICVTRMQKVNFDDTWEGVSTSLSLLLGLVLVLAPFYLLYARK